MTKKKEKLLHEAHKKYFQLIMGDLSLEQIHEIIADDVSGYGTTMDEKISEIGRLRKMVIDQREQGEGIEKSFDVKPVNLRVSPDKDMAIFNDEVKIVMQDGGKENVINLRLSTIYEFLDDKWKVVHLHGSTAVETEDDAWHLNEWKRKSEELQKLVDEKTADLVTKNRELEIEAALERVRARAMAMQNSKELSELVDTVFIELKKLDFALTLAIINIIDEASMSNTVWAKNNEVSDAPECYYMKFEDYPFHHGMMKAWKERMTKWVYKIKGKEKSTYDDYLFNETEFKRFPDIAKDGMRSLKQYVASFTFSNFGGLQTVGEKELSEVNLDILARFGKVFDLTYTRFNDLKKAEAQAREAQIEAALERVRSRTMGMQKSEELKEVIQLVYEQFVQLNIQIEHTGFIMDYKTRDDMHIWLADRHEIPSEVTIPYFDCAHWNSFIEAKAKGINLITNFLDFKEKNKFYQDLFEFIPDLPDKVKKYYLSCPGLAISTVLLDNVGLYIENFDGVPYSEEENNILMRFGKVFQQTYTRFLDLKKSEAQAREAQIQLGLERVRARAMAMHKSEQLAETAKVLFEQFNLLGKIPDRMSIGIVNEETRNFELWVTDQKGDTLDHPFLFRLDETTSVAKIYKAWKKKKDAIVVDLTGQELKDWLQFVKKEVNLPINSANIKGRRVQQAAFFSHGFLLLTSHEPVAEEIMKLLVRFAGVFDLTYTRFLDLQKAEAQAREAQIEAALERIRATMMAMHKSDELRIVVASLFKQLQSLGFKAAGCNVIIFHDDRSAEHWMTGYAHDIYPESYKIPYVDHPYFTDMFESWQKGVAFEEFIFEGKMKTEYGDWLLKNSDFKNLPDEFKEEMTSPEPHVISDAFNRYGMLETMGTEPLQQDKIVILKRFSKVFEQTYTRFLDLKKSEAQAREAQIEAALEKVRSRSIGMQKSEELKEVIQVIHDQLIHLNFKIDAAGFTMDYFQNNDWNIWIANKEQSLPTQIYIPYI